MSKYKKNKAVALRYNVDEDTSPVVIASGYGTVAEHIIDIAEKKGIPVFKDDSAASLLCMLDVYCKLIETSAQIRGVEKSRSESASAGHKEEASQPGRLRRNLVSRHSKDDS